MSTINLAAEKSFNMPYITWDMLNKGIQWALSRGPSCYATLANLKFVGVSKGYHILFRSASMNYDAWATAQIKGWGQGVVTFNTNKKIVKLYHEKWPTPERKQLFMNSLVGHECGHILLNTTDQRVAIPLTYPDLILRLQNKWGKPLAKGLPEEELFVEANAIERFQPLSLLAKKHILGINDIKVMEIGSVKDY